MKRLILCLLLLWAVPAHANSPYVVSGVTVDVTADSVTAARNQAIIEGQRKAFMNLATQLTSGTSIPEVSDAQIGDMVSDFRVEKEQFGAKRYVGIFTFRFRQNPVRAVFGSQYIPSPQELAARPPVAAETVTTTVITGNPQAALPPLPEAPSAPTVVAAEVSREAVDIIKSEAAQNIAPLTGPVDNPMPAGVDENTPIKLMLIEARDGNITALQMAQEKLRTTPGVVDLNYGSSSRVLRMAYRGDTTQLMKTLQGRGVNLQQKLATQPPIYTLAP